MYDTITFLTDFGLQDDFVGVCQGVMKRIARDAEILDVTHGIAPQAVKQGALVLARATPVPAARRAPGGRRPGRRQRAARARDPHRRRPRLRRPRQRPADARRRRGGSRGRPQPDEPALPPRRGLEDVPRARSLRAGRRAPRGRGAASTTSASEVEPASLVRLELPAASVEDGELVATIVDVDRFGNLGLNVSAAEIAAVGLEPGRPVELRFALTPYYAEVGETYADTGRGELILYEDSYGAWAIAINGGNAAALTEAAAGDEVRIRAAQPS